jgi:outer membrane protein assembly factor BamB
MSVAVTTRSYNSARTGANTAETALTPRLVGSNVLRKLFSLHFNDDPRLEAQPLYVPQLRLKNGAIHDVVYVATMANNIWAFDANNGNPLWPAPVNLGPPVRPKPVDPHPATEIDRWGINILWGILSTPAIDIETKTLYAVAWSSPNGSVDNASHSLHAIDITDGSVRHAPLIIQASAPDQVAAGQAVPRFVSSRQKQRSSLLLAPMRDAGGVEHKTLFVACGMTHEENDPTHGWLLAYDLATFRQTAAWCTTPHATGCGIWQAGQGPAADEDGGIYVMTGNYGEDKIPVAGDFPESFIKFHYTVPPNNAAPGKLAPVAWFTPFRDIDRNPNGQDNFRDYDLGSGGPVPLPGTNLVLGAGKDGVLYVLDKDPAKFGQGSHFGVLKQQPIFFTYFPGFNIDASQVPNLDRLWDGKTHHLHGTPVFWHGQANGPMMLFVWGENENLRAWKIDAAGQTTFVAKSAEVASATTAGKGGMPGGFLALTSNGDRPDTAIVWALAPVGGDANQHVVEGILRAYDATVPDPHPNADGTPRLKLLWDSQHIPGNHFNHAKFCPPVVADGKIFVPTYDGRVDVYGMRLQAAGQRVATNANRLPNAR